MSKYRIIKVKHWETLHTAQKKVFIFWYTLVEDVSLSSAELAIELDIYREKTEKANPKNIVVKEFKA